MAVSALLFVLACAARLCRLRARDRAVHDAPPHTVRADDNQQQPTTSESRRSASSRHPSLGDRFRSLRSGSAWLDFTQRLQHCLLILGCIFYLRVCVLSLKGFRCALLPDPLRSAASDAESSRSLYLIEDGSTRCWTGQHALTAGFALLLLVVHIGGLPLFCFALLMRAFANDRTGGVVGWMRARWSFLRDQSRQAPGVGEKKAATRELESRASDGASAVSWQRAHARALSGG